MPLRLLSRLPLSALYALCGGVATLLRVFGWRRQLVDDGLARCLAGVDADGRDDIAHEFYKSLGRLVAEVLYADRITPAELEDRLRFENDDIVRDALAGGRRLLIVAGHHCNWEWLLLEVSRRFGETMLVPYKPISRAGADRWMLSIRSRFGADMVPMKEFGPYLVARRRKVRLIAMLADQSPSAKSENQVWLTFFGQDTSFFQGPGWIGARLGFEPVFIAMRPDGPGRYVARFEPLTEPGQRLDADGILRAYVRALEEQIQKYPAQYFWAYNRWKRSRPANG